MRNHLTEGMKSLVRGRTRTYELVRAWRARAQDAEYVARSRKYASASPCLFSPPGYLSRSAEILHRRWERSALPHRDTHDVRIFAAVATDPGGGPHFKRALTESFDTVHIELADYRTAYAPDTVADLSWRDRLQRDLVEAFVAAHSERPFDLVFAYGTHLEFEPATLQTLRSHGVPVCVLSLDDKHRFEEVPSWGYPNGQKPLIGAVDVHLTNTRECLRWFLAEGASVYYLPGGVDTELFAPRDVPSDIDVSFLGQRYGVRGRFVEALRNAGVEIACFGPGWDTKVLSDDEKIELFSRSKINLGIGGIAYSDRITCIKGRDFEVPAAGGVYLTTYDPELAGMFDIGREILCYRNEIDCADQIRYYLERDDERRLIGEAARERCLRDHTWEKRLSHLLEWLGILKLTSDRSTFRRPSL